MSKNQTNSTDPEQKTPIDEIREQAANWLLRLEDESIEEVKTSEHEFKRWLTQDIRHQKVFDQMHEIWTASIKKPKRNVFYKNIVSNLSSIALISIIGYQLPWDYWTASNKSGVGEIKKITLVDGSSAVLNTNTAINVKFDEKKRVIELVRGEVLFTIAPNKLRPFTVKTTQGDTKAMGTIFSVLKGADKTIVNVYESNVKVIPKHAPDKAKIISAGKSTSLNKTKVNKIFDLKQKKPDWSQNKLAFLNMPLTEVVEKLDDYRKGSIFISPEVKKQNLYFTGLVPANNSDAALNLIANSLDLKLNQFTAYNVWFEIHPDSNLQK